LQRRQTIRFCPPTGAGSAGEAEESGATLEAIRSVLTHSTKLTTLRYIRRRSEWITGEVADLRSALSARPKTMAERVRTACQNHVRIANGKVRGFNQLVGRSERI
jgi:hypothetical protein